MDTLVFLGTGDAMGVPRVYCDCTVCMETRLNGSNRRLRSLVMIQGQDGDFLIDCGPDWRSQMEMQGIRFAEKILVTHAHFDHIGGLPEWADACRWLGRKGELYAPQEVIDTILKQFPWLEKHMKMTAVDDGIVLGGWEISGWRVCHGANGYAYAYRLEKNGYRWVYCSDSIGLNEEEKKPLHDLDLLVLGTSFYHETAEYSKRSVYDMREAAELLNEVQPVKAIYTHMSHDVDLNAGYSLPTQVTLARTGMKVELGY
ncbi:MBL fold metallo-hydrolase [Paenibacillus sp. KQZ6P-2]|uniref:MBL fold metallo-hydrolase n=1 Tax=Paenibacillus mangrovi TaxID=2931978 RepID=A0A9X2B3P3_9BACL|nr:MBL fold metallo-hydrolase [Paenibacillus mangrovi]MCJ8013170.1 MBL fold metallo-hydrolase [Paenibacillus mangrovi]